MRPALSSTAYSSAIRTERPSASTCVLRSVSVEVRPSRMRTVRSTCSDTAGSWVTISVVTPRSLFTVSIAASTSALVASSSSPVGSSASSTRGPLARATAIATRCFCPPDS